MMDRSDRVSWIWEEEIRSPTHWSRVLENEIRRRPPEQLVRSAAGWVRSTATGGSVPTGPWTALLSITNLKAKNQPKERKHMKLIACLDPNEMHVFRFAFYFLFFFFFLLHAFLLYGDKSIIHTLLSTIHALFSTVHGLKNIKNGFHVTIYIFKNYFTTVFLVFSFQF